MQSALIVHSKHTENYAKLISGRYREVKFLKVSRPPTEQILKIKNDRDVVIGIGGGSVIDTAKIIAKDKRAVAIPTTAAGASVTPYATIWGKEKSSILTKRPILKMDYKMHKVLPAKVRQSTSFDALSHAIESFWSKKATRQSRRYAKEAISLISGYLRGKKDINKLITAGNLAGEAIAITKTNIVHAVSYPITIKYGIDHGTACGILLPYFVNYIHFKELPRIFNFDSTKRLAAFLKRAFIAPKIRNFDAELIAKKAMKYGKIQSGPKKINRKNLQKILKNIADENNRH